MIKPIRNQVGGFGNLLFKQAYLLAQFWDGNIPDVYVQSIRYWEKYQETIKSMFGGDMGQTDAVALQIRRGDYNNNPFYMDITKTDYYQKAIEMFPNDKFLVFCHDNQNPEIDKADKEWCRAYLDKLIPNRYEINQPKTESEDMNKMASCKGIIGANSTFAWWAAFLSNAKCVFPKSWFADGLQRCELLPEWEQL